MMVTAANALTDAVKLMTDDQSSIKVPPPHVRGEFKKYAELFNFLLVYMYNELISQHNCRRDRYTSVSGVSIPLCHS